MPHNMNMQTNTRWQVGDFYEAYYGDAARLSELSDITLTAKRYQGQRVPMARLPRSPPALPCSCPARGPQPRPPAPPPG